MQEVAAEEPLLQADENPVGGHGPRDDDKASGVGPSYVSRIRTHLPLRDTKDTAGAVPVGGVGGGGWQHVARRGARESGDVVGNKELLVGMMSRSRLLCLVMMLDLMTMSVQASVKCSIFLYCYLFCSKKKRWDLVVMELGKTIRVCATIRPTALK